MTTLGVTQQGLINEAVFYPGHSVMPLDIVKEFQNSLNFWKTQQYNGPQPFPYDFVITELQTVIDSFTVNNPYQTAGRVSVLMKILFDVRNAYNVWQYQSNGPKIPYQANSNMDVDAMVRGAINNYESSFYGGATNVNKIPVWYP